MKHKWFILGAVIAATLQSGALGMIIYDRAQLLQNGREVVLQSGMVDPRDLFRGHYVTLNLSISRIPKEEVAVEGELERAKEVFVTLKPGGDDGFWLPETIYAEKPKETEKPYIKGTLRSLPRKTETSAGDYRILFKIDRYFAEKKRAKDLEKVRRDRNLGVVVALDGEGGAAIKGISVEGKLIYNEPIL